MKYKVIKRGEPGVAGGGIQKFYVSPYYEGSVDIRKLSEQLARESTLSKLDTMAVIIGLVDQITTQIKDGKIVRLGDLGSFRLSFSSSRSDSPDNVGVFNIKKTRVIFSPSVILKDALGTVPFQQVADVVGNAYRTSDDPSTDNASADQAA